MSNVIVFGSLNMDLVAQTSRLPMAGETLQGENFFRAAGGKGANQAVAVAKLGVSTRLIGRLGGDSFGMELLSGLQASGVETNAVLIDDTTTTGVAAIAVDRLGENTIIVIPGANGRVDETDSDRLQHFLPQAVLLLMQLEIPLPAVLAAAQAAKKAGVPVILDPAPAQDLPDELYPLIDIITPNETEASRLVGFKVDGQETAAQAATILQQRGVKKAIVKLGEKGVFCAAQNDSFFIPAFSVEAVDTVAAGDAFNGGLAAALAVGHPLRKAVLWGAAAGAISTTKAGAQPSLPDRPTFDRFLEDKKVNTIRNS